MRRSEQVRLPTRGLGNQSRVSPPARPDDHFNAGNERRVDDVAKAPPGRGASPRAHGAREKLRRGVGWRNSNLVKVRLSNEADATMEIGESPHALKFTISTVPSICSCKRGKVFFFFSIEFTVWLSGKALQPIDYRCDDKKK